MLNGAHTARRPYLGPASSVATWVHPAAEGYADPYSASDKQNILIANPTASVPQTSTAGPAPNIPIVNDPAAKDQTLWKLTFVW